MNASLSANHPPPMQKIPATPLFLNPGLCNWELDQAVHVWRFPQQMISISLLTEDEKQFAARFRLEEDRNRFITGRQALRLLLTQYLDSNRKIILRSQSGGKPFVSEPPFPISFNLSHSGHWILLAFASQELGIDIEKINPDFIFQDLLDEHFSEEEKSFVQRSSDPLAVFYYLWTRKEALTKAWGTGLQENLKKVDVLDGFHHQMNNQVWTLSSLFLSSDYPAALAYAGLPKSIFYFDGGQLDSLSFPERTGA
jgi:4'-phosphopantetheinyl transferase